MGSLTANNPWLSSSSFSSTIQHPHLSSSHSVYRLSFPLPRSHSVHFLSISSLVSQRAGVAKSLKFLQESPGNSEEKNVKEENSYRKDDKPRRQHSNVNPKTILTPSENNEEGLESRKGLLSFYKAPTSSAYLANYTWLVSTQV